MNALAPGTVMQWRHLKVTVLHDTGKPGLDGRHWVYVAAECVAMAWHVHVQRHELNALAVATGVAGA